MTLLKEIARRGFILRSLIILVIGLLLVLIVWGSVEVGIRFFFGYIDATNPYINKEKRKNAAIQEAYDLSLWEIPGVKYRKNASLKTSLDGEEISVKINSRGFRTHEFQTPKPPGLFRIICVGGSTTVIGRTNDETYPALLEKRLRQSFPEKKIEVLNFGISKFGTSQAVNLSLDSLRYQPDLIIKYNGVNDLWWDYFIMLNDRLPWWKRLLSRSYACQWFFWKFFLPPDNNIRRDLRSGLVPTLRELAGQLRKRGAKLVIVTFVKPDLKKFTRAEKYYLDFNVRSFWGQRLGTLPFIRIEPYLRAIGIYNEVLREFCRKNKVTCLDLAREFPQRFNLFVDLCHFSQPGIEQASEIIGRDLIDQELLKP